MRESNTDDNTHTHTHTHTGAHVHVGRQTDTHRHMYRHRHAMCTYKGGEIRQDVRSRRRGEERRQLRVKHGETRRDGMGWDEDVSCRCVPASSLLFASLSINHRISACSPSSLSAVAPCHLHTSLRHAYACIDSCSHDRAPHWFARRIARFTHKSTQTHRHTHTHTHTNTHTHTHTHTHMQQQATSGSAAGCEHIQIRWLTCLIRSAAVAVLVMFSCMHVCPHPSFQRSRHVYGMSSQPYACSSLRLRTHPSQDLSHARACAHRHRAKCDSAINERQESTVATWTDTCTLGAGMQWQQR